MRIILLILMVVVLPAWGAPLALKYGVNEVDVNADGVKDMIVKARWENFTAHSFDNYMVMVRLEGKDYPAGVYEVPKGDAYDYQFRTVEGADCLRTGYVFELDKQGLLEVTQYSLDEGVKSYCEAAIGTVTRFRLTDGNEQMVTPFYLKKVEERKMVGRFEKLDNLLK